MDTNIVEGLQQELAGLVERNTGMNFIAYSLYPTFSYLSSPSTCRRCSSRRETGARRKFQKKQRKINRVGGDSASLHQAEARPRGGTEIERRISTGNPATKFRFYRGKFIVSS